MTDAIELEMDDKKVNLLIRWEEFSASSIRNVFMLPDDVLVRLSFKVGKDVFYCGYENNYFILPEKNQSSKFFVETYKPAQIATEPTTNVVVSTGSTTDEEALYWKPRINDEHHEGIMKSLGSLHQNFLYYEDSSKVKHCVTPINKKIVATYRHEGNLHLTSEFTKENPIIIRSYFDLSFQIPAKVLEATGHSELLFFEPIDEYFRNIDPTISNPRPKGSVPWEKPRIAETYLMLGLPNDRNNIFTPIVGQCTGKLGEDFYGGTSEHSNTDIGAPIWNTSCQLIGMVINRKGNDDVSKKALAFIPAGLVYSDAMICYEHNHPSGFERNGVSYSYT